MLLGRQASGALAWAETPCAPLCDGGGGGSVSHVPESVLPSGIVTEHPSAAVFPTQASIAPGGGPGSRPSIGRPSGGQPGSLPCAWAPRPQNAPPVISSNADTMDLRLLSTPLSSI